jgi:hypothetical protein
MKGKDGALNVLQQDLLPLEHKILELPTETLQRLEKCPVG